MGEKLNTDLIIDAYKKGESLTSISKRFETYATSIRRLLIKNGVELRHDSKEKGKYYVEDGDKLIEWAKAQGRLVTRTELASAIGKTKLSRSYFEKYPELGKYIKNHTNSQLEKYAIVIANWLDENNIRYKPNDRTALGVSVNFLLLGEYSNIALQIIEKPSNISKQRHSDEMMEKKNRAHEKGMRIIFLSKEDLEHLDELKKTLDMK